MIINKFDSTEFDGLYIYRRNVFKDARGSLDRLYCKNLFREITPNQEILQINHTITKEKGTVKGLHYQLPPFSETKIISCIKGKIWDVAIDLRIQSKTYLKFFSILLSEEDIQTVVIPKGFAHGYQSLEENTEIIYLHTSEYKPEYERGLNPFDKTLSIEWPIEVTICSERDRNHPDITSNFKGIE